MWPARMLTIIFFFPKIYIVTLYKFIITKVQIQLQTVQPIKVKTLPRRHVNRKKEKKVISSYLASRHCLFNEAFPRILEETNNSSAFTRCRSRINTLILNSRAGIRSKYLLYVNSMYLFLIVLYPIG